MLVLKFKKLPSVTSQHFLTLIRLAKPEEIANVTNKIKRNFMLISTCYREKNLTTEASDLSLDIAAKTFICVSSQQTS